MQTDDRLPDRESLAPVSMQCRAEAKNRNVKTRTKNPEMSNRRVK